MIPVTVTAIVCGTAAVLFIHLYSVSHITETALYRAGRRATALAEPIDSVLGSTEAFSVENKQAVERIMEREGLSDWVLFKEDGTIIVEYRSGEPTARAKATLREQGSITTALLRQTFEALPFDYRIVHDAAKIAVYIPLSGDASLRRVLYTSIPLSDIATERKRAAALSYGIAGLVFLVCIICGVFALLFIILPLNRISRAVYPILEREFDIRIPVVRRDEIGIISFTLNELSCALKNLRKDAPGLNPLTGLPGTAVVARYIDELLAGNTLIAMILIDLDNFRIYNDRYGFERGDDVLRFTRDCIKESSQKQCPKEPLIGHPGCDDFVVVCEYDVWEHFARTFITTFDRGICRYYSSTDKRNGCVEIINRKGEKLVYPLLSVSVAVVSNITRPFKRYAEMMQVAAELRNHLKSRKGSNYALDRRHGAVRDDSQTFPPPQQSALL